MSSQLPASEDVIKTNYIGPSLERYRSPEEGEAGDRTRSYSDSRAGLETLKETGLLPHSAVVIWINAWVLEVRPVVGPCLAFRVVYIHPLRLRFSHEESRRHTLTPYVLTSPQALF